MLEVARSIAVAQLYRHPKLLDTARRLRPRPSGATFDHAAYARHLYSAFAPHCPGGRTLEIGPGTSLGTSLLLAKNGCHAYAMDLVDLRAPSWSASEAAIGEGKAHVEYLIGKIDSIPFASGGFDFVFSNSCLEHVANPAGAIAEIARVLRPGGRTAHQIDFRDHWHEDDPLRFLKYGERLWSMMNRPGPGYQNRWRLSQYLQLFAAHGFDTEVEINLVATAAQEQALANAAKRFQVMSRQDLVTLSARVVAQRSASRGRSALPDVARPSRGG